MDSPSNFSELFFFFNSRDVVGCLAATLTGSSTSHVIFTANGIAAASPLVPQLSLPSLSALRTTPPRTTPDLIAWRLQTVAAQ